MKPFFGFRVDMRSVIRSIVLKIQHFETTEFIFFITGVEDEIHTSPNYNIQGGTYQESRSNPEQEYEQHRQNRHYNYQNNDNNPDEDENYDEVTYDDLRPDRFDNNHPDTIDFRIPSHNELQKKYKTVSTSASEVVEDVIGK